MTNLYISNYQFIKPETQNSKLKTLIVVEVEVKVEVEAEVKAEVKFAPQRTQILCKQSDRTERTQIFKGQRSIKILKLICKMKPVPGNPQ